MSIVNGQTITAADFISSSSGSADSGKVPKLDSVGQVARGFIKASFGGTGADGALSISSGTTTIDLGGARIFIKNYTSISITGTGKLAFTNPSANGTLIIFKVQGNVTVTSSTVPAIDLRNIGASGGSGTGSNNPGNDGLGYLCPAPTGGQSTATATAGTVSVADFSTGGAFAVNARNSVGARLSTSAALKGAFFCGAGGGSGSGGSSSTSGAGGLGGGGLFIQCGGALSISSTIDASGAAGGASSGTGGTGVSSAGGRGGCGNSASQYPTFGSSASGVTIAGGGGGCIIILYNTLTANTGTYTITGGTAGSTGSGLAASAGADGFSLVAQNTEIP